MKTLVVRLLLLLCFVLIVGYAKFLLVWMSNVKSHAEIFFDFTTKSHEWYSFLLAALLYVMQLVLLIAGGYSVWFLLQVFLELGLPQLEGYKTEFFFILPLCVLGLLNGTYFFYNYVGVYSSSEYDGPRGAPAMAEYPSVAFDKGDVHGIEEKISALENDDDYEDEVKTRRFLFLGTAAVNGYSPRSGNVHGFVDYLSSLFAALIECTIIMLIYLFLPLTIYEVYQFRYAKTNVIKQD